MLLKRTSSIEEPSDLPEAIRTRMIQSLRGMGIDNSHAILALRSVKYESEERALAYLYDKNPISFLYEHEFIQLGISTSICQLCEDDRRFHKAFLPMLR